MHVLRLPCDMACWGCRLLPAVLDCLVEVNGRLRPDTHKIVVSPVSTLAGLERAAQEETAASHHIRGPH
eukprot:scaffold213702_cov22-Tisochrysis_lutea.AAC.1